MKIRKYIRFLVTATKKMVVLDYVFIGVFLLIFLGFFIFTKRKTVYIPVTFKVTDERSLNAVFSPKPDVLQDFSPRVDFAQGFIVGDMEKNEFGQATATITGVDSYDISPNNQAVFVTVNVKAIYSPRKNQYTVKSRPITYGASIPFIFKNITFTGLVVNFPHFESAQQAEPGITRVKVQLRQDSREFSEVFGVPHYLATAIKAGDSITNSNDEIMATIISVETRPATRTVVTGSGTTINTQDPSLLDVFYTIDLATKQVNDKTYMFDYFPVLIGETIPLNFPTVSVYPTIIEILKQE